MTVQAIPPGFHTITPYLIVDDLPRVLEFLEQAFGAEVLDRQPSPDGALRHARARVGSSMVMMGQATDAWKALCTMLYLYVEDCDATFQQALDAGAEVVQPIHDAPYGDRNGGLRGPGGNYWWIATRKEDLTTEEITQRMAVARGGDAES